MVPTDNGKKYTASLAGDRGAYMGKEVKVPMGTYENPTPKFSVPMPDNAKSAPSFETNDADGDGPGDCEDGE